MWQFSYEWNADPLLMMPPYLPYLIAGIVGILIAIVIGRAILM